MQNRIAGSSVGTANARIPNEARGVAVDVTSLPRATSARGGASRPARRASRERDAALRRIPHLATGSPTRPPSGWSDTRSTSIGAFARSRATSFTATDARCRSPSRSVPDPRFSRRGPGGGASPARQTRSSSAPTYRRSSRRAAGSASEERPRSASARPPLPARPTADADPPARGLTGPRRHGAGKFDRAPIVDLRRAGPWSGVSTRRRLLRGAHRGLRLGAHVLPYRGEGRWHSHGLAEGPRPSPEEAMTYLGRDRASLRKAIRRYAEALRDGHVFLFDEDRNVPHHPGAFASCRRAAGGLAVSRPRRRWWLGDVVPRSAARHRRTVAEGSRFESGSSARPSSLGDHRQRHPAPPHAVGRRRWSRSRPRTSGPRPGARTLTYRGSSTWTSPRYRSANDAPSS